MHFLPEIDLIALVQLIGYPGLFTIIFLESGVFFGFFLPGASLLFVTGVLAGTTGVFNIWVLIPLLLVAAILGDQVGYLFGAKVGVRLFTRKDSRFFKQNHVDKTRVFFEKYGTYTILLARFVPIVRTFAPILAGVGTMNYRTFLIFNVLGAFLWVGGVTLFGYFVGALIPNAETYITPVVLIIIVLTCIPLITHWFRRKKILRITKRPRAVVFDLDDTLAESFQPPKPEIVEKLAALLGHMPVAIMSAAGFPRLEREFLPTLSKSPHAKHLYLLPNSTAQAYAWKDGLPAPAGASAGGQAGSWQQVYDNELTEEERTRIKQALEESVAKTKVLKGVVPHGRQVIDRGAQIAYAAIGVEASEEEKQSWDIDKVKRNKLRRALRRRLPDYEVLIGGRTTLDVTKKGITKAHGVRWLSKELGIKPREMLYIGDALYPGGNDAVVIPTGIKTLSTTGPEETAELMNELQEICANTGSTKKR